MTDMIERVARAVKDCEAFPLGDMREYLSPKDAITIARAAIAAMREPTDEMLDAATRSEGDGNLETDARNTYCAMIDAALECSTKQTEK